MIYKFENKFICFNNGHTIIVLYVKCIFAKCILRRDVYHIRRVIKAKGIIINERLYTLKISFNYDSQRKPLYRKRNFKVAKWEEYKIKVNKMV